MLKKYENEKEISNLLAGAAVLPFGTKIQIPGCITA